MKDLGLTKGLLTAVSGIIKTTARQQHEQSQQQAPAYNQHYGKLGSARPLTMEEAKAATQDAHAPARRVAATIRGMYVKEDLDEAKKVANDPFEKETLKKRKERTSGEAMDEGKTHTIPKTEREKDLAAAAEPKDKITHKDVMVKRGVLTREGWEDMMKAVRERSATQPNGGDGKKKGTAYGGSKQKDVKEKDVKEAAQISTAQMSHQGKTTIKHIDSPGVQLRMAAHDIKPGIKGYRDRIALLKAAQAQGKLKEATELNTDTPGNDWEHQCAVHVKHSKLGEGRTLYSQHADPAADGSIEWYDVMFEHGIEKVMTTDLEILVSESHMSHKKKKK